MSYKNFDFIKLRNVFFIFSGLITVAGIVVILFFGMNLGIDFSSGTRIDVKASHELNVNQFSQTISSLGLEAEQPVLSGPNNTITSVRVKKQLSQTEIANVKSALKKQFGVTDSNVNVSTVSPQIGRELARNAFWAILISSVCICIYIWIRFEFLQGLAAVIALLHDAFIIVSVFSLLHIEVNIDFIAAVLTIVGYSINDTIVTFDRIRENMKLNKKKIRTFEDLADIINKSIQQTFVRSVNTVITVLIAAIALLIFGGPSIKTFTIALLIGLISGAYSSIFIASPLWAIMKIKAIQKNKKNPSPSV
jgi:preprotein translocase subunit SecF